MSNKKSLPEVIAKIDGLFAKATQGPWTADEHVDDEDRGYLADPDSGHFNIRSGGPLNWTLAVTIGDVAEPKKDEKYNALLIVALKNNWERVTAELRRMMKNESKEQR